MDWSRWKSFFPKKEAVEQYEEQARREALNLFNILDPANIDPADFLQTGSHPAGGDPEQTKNLNEEKSKGGTAKREEKPNIFYLESKIGRKLTVEHLFAQFLLKVCLRKKLKQSLP